MDAGTGTGTGAGTDVQSILATVMATVTQKLAAWSDAFYRDVRAGTANVSTKLNGILDGMVVLFDSSCETDTSDDVSMLHMPVHYVQLLDALRAQRPDVYAELLQWAVNLNGLGNDATPTDRRTMVEQAADAALQTAQTGQTGQLH